MSGEEHSARDLVRFAALSEEIGFEFAFVSDHFHPWNFEQSHSSNIWPVLGAVAQRTRKIGLVSAVTCPILRLHPTTLAQQASTVYHLSQGRFVLGLGTGENLNEHITGELWPNFPERLARLSEAVEGVRLLLTGEEVDWRGDYFTIHKAQLFDAASGLQIFVASSGEKSATFARERADGLICLGARPELAKIFGEGKPRLAQLSVCWAEDQTRAEETAHRYFPEVAMPGTTFAALTTPREFARAARSVRRDDVAAAVPCGPDPARYLEAMGDCFRAGFDAVALHQIGPDQEGFMEFWARELRL